MADDEHYANPAGPPEALRPTRVPVVRQTHASAASPAEPRRSIFRYLRPILILGILLLAVIVGCDAKSHANPGAEPSSFRKQQPPQYINVYETNPQIPITVTITLGQGFLSPNYLRYEGPTELRMRGFTGFSEEVNVTAKPTGSVTQEDIMITSSTRPLTGRVAAIAGSAPPIVFRLGKAPRGLTSIVHAERFAIPLLNTLGGSVFFDSVPIIFQDNGSTFGHLPSVGTYSSPLHPPTSCLEAGFDRRTGQLKNVVPFFFSVPIPAGERTESFGCPFHSSYTEIIQNIVPALKNEQIDYMNPLVNSTSGVDYIWHSDSTFGLDPIFKATDPNAVDSQNQAAFISGIAFGVAGAAAIAVVQELPKERRRKSPPKDADSPS
jgi:hypothetical protein